MKLAINKNRTVRPYTGEIYDNVRAILHKFNIGHDSHYVFRNITYISYDRRTTIELLMNM